MRMVFVVMMTSITLVMGFLALLVFGLGVLEFFYILGDSHVFDMVMLHLLGHEFNHTLLGGG